MIPLNAPSLGPLEEQYVLEALRSGWITGGPFVERFEREFAAWVGRPHAVACASGTAALVLALMAVNPRRVLAPTYTCDAVANAVWAATRTLPILADVEDETWGLAAGPNLPRGAELGATAAVLVHTYGVPARDTMQIVEFCRTRDLVLIEDASEAHGAQLDGRRVGGFGDLGVFSFRGEKAIWEDELVPTPSGFVKAKDVRVGDKLIASDGSPTRVEGVYPQPVQPLWRVQFSDRTSLVTTADHLWTVDWAYGPKKTRRRQGPVLTSQLHSGFTIPLLSRPVELATRPVPLNPYLLGLLLGDGGLTESTITLTSADEEIVATARALANEIDANLLKAPYYRYEYSGVVFERKHQYVFRPHDRYLNVILGSLRKLGLWKRRSHEKFVPEVYLWNSPEIRLALLQGLLDTDGAVGKNGSVSYTTTSPQLRDDVLWLVRSLGGTAFPHKAQTYYCYRGTKKPARLSYDITILLPESMAPLRLSRKLARVRPKQKNKRRRFIGREPFGEGKSVCFRVAHPDHLYAAGFGLVLTHNTMGAGQFGVVVTDRDDWATAMRQVANNGLPDPTLRYWSTRHGLNFQPPHLSAALALAQLHRADELIAARNRVAAGWRRLLPEAEFQGAHGTPAWWLTAVRFPTGVTRLLPQDLASALRERGVETRPGFYPLHWLPHLSGAPRVGPFPVAERLLQTLLILPSGPAVTEVEQEYVVGQIREILGVAPR